MPSSPNEAAASRNHHSRANREHLRIYARRITGRCGGFGAERCFAIVLLAAFARPLLALVNYAAGSELYSYILLIPFVSAYLLYLRRDQLPKNYVTDLPLAIVSLAAGLGVLVFTYWLDFAGLAPSR